MAIKFESLSQLNAQRNRVSQIAQEREALIDRIGTGEIKVGSSWENTLRVGEVRGRVRSSAARLNEKLTSINTSISEYHNAQDYLKELQLRESQLSIMSEHVASGNLPEDILLAYQQEYTELLSRPESNIQLKNGLSKIQAENDSQKSKEAHDQSVSDSSNEFNTTTTTTTTHEEIELTTSQLPVGTVLQQKDKETEFKHRKIDTISHSESRRASEPVSTSEDALSITSTENEALELEVPRNSNIPRQEAEGSLVAVMPNGQEIKGKVAELHHTLSSTRPDQRLSTEQLCEAIYPGVDYNIARLRLSVLMSKLRSIYSESNISLINTLSALNKRRGAKGEYYVQYPTDDDPQIVIREEKSDIFLLDNERDPIIGELGTILNLITNSQSSNPITFNELLQKTNIEDPNHLQNRLAQAKNILRKKGIGITHIKNQDDPEDFGIFTENLRDKKILIHSFGEVLELGNKHIRLTEPQRKLLWDISRQKEKSQFSSTLSKLVFGSENPDVEALDRFITELNDTLTDLTGESDVLIATGNDVLGDQYRIKDAKFALKSQYLPVYPPRFQSIRLLMDENSRSHAVRKSFGITRGRRPRSYTFENAATALANALNRLDSRDSKNITTEDESQICIELIDFMQEKGISDKSKLKELLRDRLRSFYDESDNSDQQNSNGEEVQHVQNSSEPVELTQGEAVQLIATPQQVEILTQDENPKVSQLEQRDPEIRQKIISYLNELQESGPELSSATYGMISRHFPRLVKADAIDNAVNNKYISRPKVEKGSKRFDTTAIIAILYLEDHGKGLPSRQKKQVEFFVKRIVSDYIKSQETE
jgi:hypothetical protein